MLSIFKRNLPAMLAFPPSYAFRFADYFSNQYFVPGCKLAPPGVADVETQPVRPREMPARRRVIKLRKVLDLKSPGQQVRLERTGQVNQKETALAAVEYMR